MSSETGGMERARGRGVERRRGVRGMKVAWWVWASTWIVLCVGIVVWAGKAMGQQGGTPPGCRVVQQCEWVTNDAGFRVPVCHREVVCPR